MKLNLVFQLTSFPVISCNASPRTSHSRERFLLPMTLTTFGNLAGVPGFLGYAIFGGKRPDHKLEKKNKKKTKKTFGSSLSRTLIYSRRPLRITLESGLSGSIIVFLIKKNFRGSKI